MGLFAYNFGKKGEDVAVKWLAERGFCIIKRNFKSRFGEIDIIAKKGEITHFIEVKATSKDYEASYRLTPSKYAKILKAIDFYLLSADLAGDYQLDLLVVAGSECSLIENISL